MAKQKQTKSGSREKNVKKKGSLGGKLIKSALVLGLIGGSGWWLFMSDSDSKIRKSCLKSLSLMVDRLDEASSVWEKRSFPGEDEESSPVNSGTESSQKSGPGAAASSKGKERETSGIEAKEKNEATSRNAVSKRKNTKEEKEEPPGEVTEEDKEQLRNLLRDIQAE